MNIFQLDECINSKSLAFDCNSQGLSHVERYPADMVNASVKDPDMLLRFMSGSVPLLTTDKNLPIMHSDYIPNINPGILVIDKDHDGTGPMTLMDVRRILTNFKKNFPEWHSIKINNSIVTLTPKKAIVDHVLDKKLLRDAVFLFSELNWAGRFKKTLSINYSSSVLVPSSASRDFLRPPAKKDPQKQT